MSKRGTPLPVNHAMNRSRAKLGLELPAWMGIGFVSVAVFLVGFKLFAVLSFPAMAIGAYFAVKKHPKIFNLLGHMLLQKSHYDPRKTS